MWDCDWHALWVVQVRGIISRGCRVFEFLFFVLFFCSPSHTQLSRDCEPSNSIFFWLRPNLLFLIMGKFPRDFEPSNFTFFFGGGV